MKRTFLLLIFVLLTAQTGTAGFLGIKKASETIAFPLFPPIDSAYGIERKPDSVHVFTYSDNGTSSAFSTRSTTYPFNLVGIDTTKNYGDTLYWFTDQIQDIDGAGGNFILAIDVVMFYSGYPRHTFNTVQVISDSLENFLDASMDSSSSAAVLSKNNLDSLQSQDDWVSSLVSSDNIGINWGDITNPGTAQNLTLTSISSVTGSVNDVTAELDVNVVKISFDAAAADSLEAMLDGTGSTLSLNQLNVIAPDGNKSAVVITGNGTGNGLDINGGATGNGIDITSGTDKYGIGINATAGTTARGISITADGYGIYSASNSSNGVRFAGLEYSLFLSAGSSGDLYAPLFIDDIWDEDSTGHYTSPNMAFTSALTQASSMTEQTIAKEVWTIKSGDDSSYTAQSMGANSAGWDGGSSLTIDQIAHGVWGHSDTGWSANTLGDQLTDINDEVAGLNGWTPILDNDSLIVDQSTMLNGNGTYSYTLNIYDSTISQTISGVKVVVRDLAQSTVISNSTSNSSGEALFNLDADSFLVVASSPGYTFDVFDTIVVTGSSADTVYGEQFSPGAPSSPDLVRVWGFVYNINGQPEPDADIIASLPSGVVRYNNNLIVSPFTISTTTDNTGYFYLDLIPSDSLTPVNQLYEFTISLTNGTILRQRLSVPDSTSWQLIW